ncbi:acyl-CoA thioesterase [Nocardia farcinica]|uniref:acyl-CoA thioesterase n=1 Tax=Nocardia farcinica TaxID=37329 RepID=UPI002453C1A7|nr:acyl-CoA thioesterase [Nocardia farcinica]
MAGRTMSGVVVERVVDWQDTDAAGHYHHSTVIRWVEAAEAALLDGLGLRGLFGSIPRVRFEVDYLDRLWFGDTAAIALSVGRLGRSSVRYDFLVTRIPPDAQPPSPAARGALTAVHAPDPAARSRPWPTAVAAALRGTRPPTPEPNSPRHQ